MSDFDIEGQKLLREYVSDEYGSVILEVEVHDFYPCLDSWDYDPPKEYQSVTGETAMMPARFRGKDIIHCSISLQDESGYVEHGEFVSLRRGVRDYRFGDGDVGYESSAMVRDSRGIYIKPEEENIIDPHGGEFEMIWQTISSEPITLKENLEFLLENGHRVFEPKISTRM